MIDMPQENNTPQPTKLEKFLQFNIWHVIIIFTWIATGIWQASKFDSEIKELKASKTELETNQAELMRAINNIKVAENAYYEGRFTNLDTRVTKIENALIQVSVIANDVNWLKNYIIGRDKQNVENK